MRIRSLGVALFFVCAAWAISGCKSNAPPSSGMRITTSDCDIDVAEGPCLQGTLRPVPHIPVSGTFLPNGDVYSAGNDLSQGTVRDFGFYVSGDAAVDTGKGGAVIVNNARTPGFWNMYALWPFNTFDGTNGCGGANYVGPVEYSSLTYFEYEFDDQLAPNFYTGGGSYDFVCHHDIRGLQPASTRFAVIGSFPGTLTLGSETSFTTTYGMPLLYVYDGTRTVVATETATSVSSDGSQATFPFPSSLAQNGYSLAVVNKTSATLAAAGTNYLSIASSQTIAGNPFGVAAQYSSTTWQSADNSGPYVNGICVGQWTYNSGHMAMGVRS
jgi:hypothetical protein